MWTKRHKHIGVCRMFWPRTPGQSAFYRPCVLSVSPWPVGTLPIHTRLSRRHRRTDILSVVPMGILAVVQVCCSPDQSEASFEVHKGFPRVSVGLYLCDRRALPADAGLTTLRRPRSTR